MQRNSGISSRLPQRFLSRVPASSTDPHLLQDFLLRWKQSRTAGLRPAALTAHSLLLHECGNDVLFVFQRGFFGGNKAENDLLFADVAQRFKAACAVTVILQEETVYIAVTEQDLCYWLVSAGGGQVERKLPRQMCMVMVISSGFASSTLLST